MGIFYFLKKSQNIRTEEQLGKESRSDFRLIWNEENGYVYLCQSKNFWGKHKKIKRLEDISISVHSANNEHE